MTNTKNPKIIIPRIFGGIPIDQAYEDVMSGKDVSPKPAPIARNAGNVDGMIHVPEINLYFAKQRTHSGKAWGETHPLLATENLRMPTVEEFRRVLKYFKDSQDNELQKLYNEITQVREPWRSNWLDAYFEKRDKEWHILTGNKTKAEKIETCLRKDKTPGISLEDWLSNSTSQGLPKANIPDGNLTPRNSDALDKDTLMENRTPGISLEDWLKNSTSQGLPRQNITKGKLYYWAPMTDNNSVARFYAYSDGASLDCSGDLSNRGPDLGVFAVADAKP